MTRMGVFDNNKIPSTNLSDFMRDFSYNGYKQSDLNRLGHHKSKFSRKGITTPKEVQDASKSENLSADRFGRYKSIKSDPDKESWFNRYKASLEKRTFLDRPENYVRQSNDETEKKDLSIKQHANHRGEKRLLTKQERIHGVKEEPKTDELNKSSNEISSGEEEKASGEPPEEENLSTEDTSNKKVDNGRRDVFSRIDNFLSSYDTELPDGPS